MALIIFLNGMGKYCVAIRDNSIEVLGTIAESIRNGLASLIITY